MARRLILNSLPFSLISFIIFMAFVETLLFYFSICKFIEYDFKKDE